MAKGITSRHSGVTHAQGGCYTCKGNGEAIWQARNAVACAANHAAATGHHTWAEQCLSIAYNRKD